MNRKFLLATLIMFCTLPALAAHIKGGFFTYRYLGPGSTAGTSRYSVKLTVYMDCSATGAQISDPIPFTIFDGLTNQFIRNQLVSKTAEYTLSKTRDEECITGNQAGCYYKIVEYTLANLELTDNANGYTISYQRCCRIGGIVNVSNSGTVGNTWSVTIPGSSSLPAGQSNSSPAYLVNDTAIICAGSYFEYPFATTDPNSDSLSYSFCSAWPGGTQTTPDPQTASNPPYPPVTYQFPFSGSQPMGSNVTIDPVSGLISGVAPSTPGEYVVTVCINEYRNGNFVASSRKEIHIRAGNCQPVTPVLEPSYITCDGFTLTFQNNNSNPDIQSYFWDFGVPVLDNDTSDQEIATYTFPDTGTYEIKLIVNRNGACPDSTTALAKVYPGFFPGFIFDGICQNNPTQFTDTTLTVYGVVDSWSWDFGLPGNSDASTDQNPQWTYTDDGNYNVQLIVTNSKGCVDTIVKSVPILDKPPLDLAFRDTLICSADDVQLEAIGSGNFSWTPAVNITNPNTATPTVAPNNDTWYFVELNDNGCINNDSVLVRVVDFVSLNVRADTTICAGDSVQLNAATNGLQFAWSPPDDLTDPNIVNPIATPNTTTTYQLTAFIGSCQTTDDITITAIPYPVANAGPDTTICFETSAQLNGSHNGTGFTWTPAETLNDPGILNPIASPLLTTSYILSVTNTLGCPKPGRDTVIVTVLPDINAFAGNDTTVVVGQPLQLLATGGEDYLWTPPTWLNADDIPNPVAVFDQSVDSILYTVYVTTGECVDSADIKVTIFKTVPYVFVPTGFTPNGDGLNDQIRPIAVGMKELKYFRIYNRWGQLVFETQVNGKGWDGRIGGKLQGTGVFVWLVSGVDYLDQPFFQKGTVTLIR